MLTRRMCLGFAMLLLCGVAGSADEAGPLEPPVVSQPQPLDTITVTCSTASPPGGPKKMVATATWNTIAPNNTIRVYFFYDSNGQWASDGSGSQTPVGQGPGSNDFPYLGSPTNTGKQCTATAVIIRNGVTVASYTTANVVTMP